MSRRRRPQCWQSLLAYVPVMLAAIVERLHFPQIEEAMELLGYTWFLAFPLWAALVAPRGQRAPGRLAALFPR